MTKRLHDDFFNVVDAIARGGPIRAATLRSHSHPSWA
ncbi:hypothetical protein BVIET440_40363 [Burkholderia vietnamiensis]|jgi:hypothetical protein